MNPNFDPTRRLRRMRMECAGSAGQALVLGTSLAVLVMMMGVLSALP